MIIRTSHPEIDKHSLCCRSCCHRKSTWPRKFLRLEPRTEKRIGGLRPVFFEFIIKAEKIGRTSRYVPDMFQTLIVGLTWRWDLLVGVSDSIGDKASLVGLQPGDRCSFVATFCTINICSSQGPIEQTYCPMMPGSLAIQSTFRDVQTQNRYLPHSIVAASEVKALANWGR